MTATMMTPKAVGIAVRRARMRQDWSQSDLASRAGVTREWVGRLERGAPRLEFGKVLEALAILGLRLEAPAAETVTDADIELADDIAWSMALEDRKLTSRAYDKLLDKVVSDRLAREQGEDAI